jgi:hypothetical protein
MRLTLVPHPDTPCAPIREIAVKAARAGARLSLRYRIEGDLTQIVLAERGIRARADALWKHSCLEAFVSAGKGYGEINLSPSNRWAGYDFDGYRSGMTQARGCDLLNLEDRRAANRYELTAKLALTALPSDSDWQLGLAAVIELRDGRRCYWALRHAPGRPDFHHPDSFLLSLPPGEIS